MFFPIGKHAGWHPEILKKVIAAGHTVGSHTWSHKDLTKMTTEEAKAEIEMGIAAVSVASGDKPIAPFFRFPALRNPPEVVKYLAERNIGIFSTDWDSFDFKARKPEQVVHAVMDRLTKHGKGIMLMHDFQHATSEAVPEILKELKAKGFKIVRVVAKKPLEPKPEYVKMVIKEMGGGLDEARPMSSVIKTISAAAPTDLSRSENRNRPRKPCAAGFSLGGGRLPQPRPNVPLGVFSKSQGAAQLSSSNCMGLPGTTRLNAARVA